MRHWTRQLPGFVFFDFHQFGNNVSSCGFLWIYLGISWASWISMPISFLKFGKFSFIIPLNKFTAPFALSSPIPVTCMLACLIMPYKSLRLSALHFPFCLPALLISKYLSPGLLVRSSVWSSPCWAPLLNFSIQLFSSVQNLFFFIACLFDNNLILFVCFPSLSIMF